MAMAICIQANCSSDWLWRTSLYRVWALVLPVNAIESYSKVLHAKSCIVGFVSGCITFKVPNIQLIRAFPQQSEALIVVTEMENSIKLSDVQSSASLRRLIFLLLAVCGELCSAQREHCLYLSKHFRSVCVQCVGVVSGQDCQLHLALCAVFALLSLNGIQPTVVACLTYTFIDDMYSLFLHLSTTKPFVCWS